MFYKQSVYCVPIYIYLHVGFTSRTIFTYNQISKLMKISTRKCM